MHHQPCWEGAAWLVHVEYGPGAFVAAVGYAPAGVCRAFLVYREPYGRPAEEVLYPVPEDADAARFLQEVLAPFRG